MHLTKHISAYTSVCMYTCAYYRQLHDKRYMPDKHAHHGSTSILTNHLDEHCELPSKSSAPGECPRVWWCRVGYTVDQHVVHIDCARMFSPHQSATVQSTGSRVGDNTRSVGKIKRLPGCEACRVLRRHQITRALRLSLSLTFPQKDVPKRRSTNMEDMDIEYLDLDDTSGPPQRASTSGREQRRAPVQTAPKTVDAWGSSNKNFTSSIRYAIY